MSGRGGRVVLVLGGARSGKSAYAERRALSCSDAPYYVATGRIWDDEMSDRVAKHRLRRGEEWTTIEEPHDLVGALGRVDDEGAVALVDCLTLWITNLMMEAEDPAPRIGALLDALAAARGTVLLVSNEVGMGIVPENAMARRFRDLAGTLHQSIAAIADEVVLVVAGIPMTIKNDATPVGV